MHRYSPLLLTLLTIAGMLSASPRSAPTGAEAQAAQITIYLPALSCPTCATKTPATPEPQPSPAPENPDAFEARMIELVNQARTAAGCPAATPSSILMRAAGDWSAYMSATSDYQHAPSIWYSDPPYLYPTNAVLENIAGGSDSPDYVFSGWMASPAHRGNLEWCYHPDDPSYDPSRLYEIGVGYAGGYWTLAIGDRAP